MTYTLEDVERLAKALDRIRREAETIIGGKTIALMAQHALSGVDEGVCPTCRGVAPMEYDFRGWGANDVELWEPCNTCKGTGFLVITTDAQDSDKKDATS